MTIFGKASHPQSGWYWWGDEPFRAVTTILGSISKPALPAAAAKVVAEYVDANLEVLTSLDRNVRVDLVKGAASRKWNEAMTLGSEVHHAISDYLENTTPFPPHLTNFHKAFSSFLEETKIVFRYNEVTVYNRRCGYAGTLDLIGDVDGVLTLIDVKTGGVWPEAALQVNAYKNAEFIGIDGKEVEMPRVDRCAILQLAPDGSFNFLTVRSDEEMFRFFRHAIEVNRFQQMKHTDLFGGN